MKDTSGSAYPLVVNGDPCLQLHDVGMTLKDYFAGQVLVGFLSGHNKVNLPEEMASTCYLYANAMIQERDKE